MTLVREYRVKVIMVGDYAVGKTSLAVRFTQDRFQAIYKPSLGVDFFLKKVTFPDKGRVKILVFDTAGQEFIASLRQRYYRGASGAVIVFDLTRRETFDHLPMWVGEVQMHAGKIPLSIVGNKADLEGREVEKGEAEGFAKRHEAIYYETSALSGENVQDVFHRFAVLPFQNEKTQAEDG